MTQMTPISLPRPIARCGLAALTAALMVALIGFGSIAKAGDDHRHDDHRNHRREEDRRHGGGGGYYPPPPVVYGGAPYYYGPPPVVYSPGIGINVPGLSIGIH